MEKREFEESVISALQAIIIQNARMYDVLCMMMLGGEEESLRQILDGHDQGSLFFNPPFMNDETFAKWSGPEEE